MAERGLGATADNPGTAERAALMTRAGKRDVDRDELRGVWERQAADLGFDARALAAAAKDKGAEPERGAGGAMRDVPEDGDAGRNRRPGTRRRRPRPRGRAGHDAIPRGGGRGLGDGASLGARGGVRAHRSPCRRARPHAGPGDDRAIGTRGRRPGEGRNPARRRPAGGGGLARDREDRCRRTRDRRADARGRGPRGCPDAGLDGPGTPEQGAAHARPEGGREADPVGEGPGGWRSGLRRHRQDHHARPGPGAGGEEGLAHDRPRPVGLGGEDAGGRGRDRVRDPAAVPRAERRGRRGKAHGEGREGDARRLREDRAGGRRGLARLDRAGAGPLEDRQRGPHLPRGAGRRREAARRGRRRQALRPAPGRRHAGPRLWTRSCANAIRR